MASLNLRPPVAAGFASFHHHARWPSTWFGCSRAAQGSGKFVNAAILYIAIDGASVALYNAFGLQAILPCGQKRLTLHFSPHEARRVCGQGHPLRPLRRESHPMRRLSNVAEKIVDSTGDLRSAGRISGSGLHRYAVAPADPDAAADDADARHYAAGRCQEKHQRDS